MDITKITKPVISFIEKNGKLMSKIGAAVAVECLRYSFNLPNARATIIERPYDSYVRQATHIFMTPHNAVEQAIFAIMKQGENSSWDSDKRKAARDIMSIVEGHDSLTDGTYSFAIQALSNIADSTDWSSTKKEINGLISSIGTRVYYIEEDK